MEHKDKYRVHAHTFIPSVERLDDNPSLIQLASKARDAVQALNNVTNSELKGSAGDQSLNNADSTRKILKNSHGLVPDKITSLQSERTPFKGVGDYLKATDIVSKHAMDVVGGNYSIKQSMESTIHRTGDFLMPNTMRRFPAKAVMHGTDYKSVSAVSTSSVTTSPSSNSVREKRSPKPQLTKEVGQAVSDKHPKDEAVKTASANLDKDDVKETTMSNQSSYYRSFMSQSDRPPPMKLERNRGNHKLPVGIAVARQRTLTTPTNKSSQSLTRSTSPDLDRKDLEHALNREREVFLRENKEISNFTSMLQANAANPTIPLLNMQGSNIFQGGWEQERSLMSSLLQWQAQQQSALISNGLQSPPMWLSGTSPYHLPGNQHTAPLSSPHSSLPGYPCIGNGLGGLVFMPQFLQDTGSSGMWSSLAALCGNVATPLSNSYANLLSHQLGGLSSNELQLLQQQLMMSHGLPFSLPKANSFKLDERDANVGTARRHSPIHNKVCSPAPFRASSSPELMRQERTMSCGSADRSFYRTVVSPPLKTSSNHHLMRSVTPKQTKSKFSHHAKWDPVPVEISNHHVVNKQNSVNENRIGPTVPVSQPIPNANSPTILDLTSSSPENVPHVEDNVRVDVQDNSCQVHHESETICRDSSSSVVVDDIQTETAVGYSTDISRPFVKPNNTVSNNSWEKPVNITSHSASNRDTQPIMSSGVELLTKAVDIHMKSLNSACNLNPVRKRKLSDDGPPCIEKKKLVSESNVTMENPSTLDCRGARKSANDAVDVSAFDPEVLAAVRGITLLSQSCGRKPANSPQDVKVDVDPKPSLVTLPNDERSQSPLNDCNSDMQSTVSYGSLNDVAIISGDCMSSSELKDADNSEKVRLKRRLKKPLSSKKLTKDGECVKVGNFKLDDTMEAREVDMKMRLADLQRRYKAKQKELAKIQRKNKKDKSDASALASASSDLPSTGQRINTSPTSLHHSTPKYKFGEITALTTSQVCPRSSSSTKELVKPKPETSYDPYMGKSIFEKFASEVCAFEKANEFGGGLKDDNDVDLNCDQQQAPSGSRKRKLDKPKRICLLPGETPTVPLVDPSKKNFSALANLNEVKNDEVSKEKRSRKMKKATKNVKVKSPDDPATSSWVFKSKNKAEKQSDAKQKKSKPPKANKFQKPSRHNSTSEKKGKCSDTDTYTASPAEETAPEPEPIEAVSTSSSMLELREEDLVKGLQVLVPLEDKLLYLCHINPIQPPDIYEVTVEGERHRHRPIVMCLEQILKEAVPDIKPKSVSEVPEGSRVAAYWSHQMHCLYTGTIAFDDSDDEEEEAREEGMIQVEFDDGDSSMIPLEDIRLLPTNYPIMQPDAPFMMNFAHRRRNTSDMSNKETPKATQSRPKKAKSDKKTKASDKSPSKRSKPQKDEPDYTDQSEDCPDGAQTLNMKKRKAVRNRGKSTCGNNGAVSSSASSADDDSDVMFSDSSDDTYDGDAELHCEGKRIPHTFTEDSHMSTNTKLELWSWLDKEVQKKTVKGKAKKICHKSIKRGDEIISCGDSAVFLSAGRMHLPYIGRIESMWESWGDNMVVKVRWFYHPEETKRGRQKSHDKHPLYKSSHIDENDVQTISHKCEVVSYKEYCRRMRNNEQNVFYCAGTYDPATGQVTQEHTDKRKHSKS